MKPQNLCPWNFLALPDRLSAYETARAVVLPIPYEATISFGSGTRGGPRAIILASRQMESFERELSADPSELGIATLDELEQVVSGPEAMIEKIESAAREIIGDGKFLLSLGGEHSISYPLIKVHKSKYPDLTVLHFDAHSDLRDEYQGSRFSHASVMSRIWEVCDFISVGIRSFCGSPNEVRAESERRLIGPAEFRKSGAIANILSRLGKNIYITFDLDGFDPPLMPAVGTHEPGGLLWNETLELIREAGKSKQIVGADIVELAPIAGLAHPDFTAARLAYKIIGYSLWK